MYDFYCVIYIIGVSFCLTALKIYDKNFYYLPINIYSEIKCRYKSGISKFTIEPQLPTGLLINVNNGDISGIATIQIDSTNFKISFEKGGSILSSYITISTKYVEKGLKVVYYKMNPIDNECKSPLESFSYTPKIIRIEQTLNYTHPTPQSSSWNELSEEFVSNYEAKFDGYIYFDNTSEMYHKIVCDGACWVRINEGQMRFDLSVVGLQQDAHIGQTNTFEYEGYSKFSINYRDCNNRQKLLYFLINEDENKTTLPEYYFTPETPIVYAYSLYTLKQYSNYPVNKPIIMKSMMQSRNVVKYELYNSQLPNGMILNNETGIIFGIPIEHTNGFIRDIKIKAYLDDSSILELLVQINVEEHQGIALLNPVTGEALANPAELPIGNDFELEIYSGFDISTSNGGSGSITTTTTADTTNADYKIEMSGDLPSYLHFDSKSGKIVGKVVQSGTFDVEFTIKTPPAAGISLFSGTIGRTTKGSIIQKKRITLTIPQCVSTDNSYEDTINSHYTQISITTDTILPQKIQVVLLNKGLNKIIDSLLTETPYNVNTCTRNGIYFLEIVDAIYSYYNIFVNITVDGFTLYSFSIPGSNSNSMNANNKRSFTLDLRLVKPSISYQVDEIDWELFDTFETITPTVTIGSIQYFTIKPSILPNDIYFNTTTGVISGTATTLFSDTIYTITATNVIGTSEPFTITFKSHSSTCENNENSLLHIYVSSSIFPEYMSIIIENSETGEVIYTLNNDNIYSQTSDHFTVKNSEYNKYICVSQDVYKVTYTSTHPNKLGWKRGFIVLYLYNIGLGRYTVNDEDGGNSFTQLLNLVYLVDSYSMWEYSTEYNYLWTSEKNMNWKKEIVSKINDIKKENKKLYLRKIINLNSNLLKSPAFYLQIQVITGFIIYINGEEIFKKLPDSDNNDNNNNQRELFLESSSEILKTYSFLLPVSRYSNENSDNINNNTVISIELQKSEDDDDTKSFQKFHFVLIELFANNNYSSSLAPQQQQQQMCVNINNIGKSKIVDAYPFLKVGIKGVLNAFDNDNSIGWRDKLPNDGLYNKYPWVEYSFGNNNYYYINKMVITTNNIKGGNNVENPKDVIVEGYDEMLNEWRYLGEIENIETKLPFQKNNITFYRNDDYNKHQLYNKIRINITSLQLYNEDNFYFQVTNIGLFVCDKYYCDENDRLPYTDGGNSIKVKCDNENDNITVNFDEFYCPYSKNPKWLQTNSTCEEPPYIVDVIEKYVYYVGKDEGVVEYFKATGYIEKVTVYPDLPLGLVEVTPGKYKGTVYTEYLLRSYLFTASNKYGYFNAVVQIAVISPPTKPNVIKYIESYQLYQYVEVKSLIMVFCLGVDLYYEIEPNLPEGLSLNPFTGSISGVSTKSFSKIDFEMFIHYNANNNNNNNNNNKNNDQVLVKKISLECISSEYPSIISQENNYVFYVNEIYTNLSLFKVAGSNLKYSIDHTLPTGLTLSHNGYISGKCSEVNENPTLYTFTVSNTEGVVTLSMNLSFVEAVIPKFISMDIEKIFMIGIEVNNVKIFHAVGQNITYSIHPELPAGLSFNKNTGLISGKPIEESYVKLYTIGISIIEDRKNYDSKMNNDNNNFTEDLNNTSKNTSSLSLSSSSSSSSSLQRQNIIIGVKYSERSILLDAKQTNTFYKNVELDRDYVLVSSIGYNVKYILNSQLPSGLSFSETTGVLSGIPLQEDSYKLYNITIQSTNQNNNEINNVNITVSIEVKVLYCKKDGHWPVTEMGEKVSLSCSGTKSGNMYRNCVKNEVNILQPMWESTVDNCRVSTELMTVCIVIVVVVLAVLFFLIVVCFIKHHPIQPLE